MELRWRDYIHTDPNILTGKPVIKGTRISVEQILDLLSQGCSIEKILEEFPHLNRNQILAALAYAVDCMRTEALFEYIPPKTGTEG